MRCQCLESAIVTFLLILFSAHGFAQEDKSQRATDLLKVAAGPDDETIEKLITQLGDPNKHRLAMKSLEEKAKQAGPRLKAALREALGHESKKVREAVELLYEMLPTDVQSIGHEVGVGTIAFTPDSQYVLGAAKGSFWNRCTDPVVHVWNVASREEVAQLEGHRHWVYAISPIPGTRKLATVGCDRSVRIWEATWNDDEFVIDSSTTLEPHGKATIGLAVSANGTKLATGSEDSHGVIVDVATEEVEFSFKHSGAIYDVRFFDNDTKFVTGTWYGTIGVWDAAKGTRLGSLMHKLAVVDIDTSPDRKTLVTASFDKTLKLWDLEKLELITTLKCDGKLYSVAFSPDGKWIASTESVKNEPGNIRIWNVETKQQHTAIRVHSDSCGELTFSPNGKYLATGTKNGIQLFELEKVLAKKYE